MHVFYSVVFLAGKTKKKKKKHKLNLQPSGENKELPMNRAEFNSSRTEAHTFRVASEVGVQCPNGFVFFSLTLQLNQTRRENAQQLD